jgi:hypothetical protein
MAKRDSVYQGQVVSSDGVKKIVEFQGIKIHLDRPKGLTMTGKDKEGKPWTRTYKYDYGFIPKTLGGDGDGLDIFIGPDKDASETYWAIQNKDDGTFDEYKVFLGFTSRDAAIGAFRDHIPVKFLGGMVSMRLDMMKAMLGMHPTGYFLKTAMVAVSRAHELQKVAGLRQQMDVARVLSHGRIGGPL